MSILQAVPFDEIKRRGSIKDADVVRIRRAYYEDGRVTPEEANRLFELNDTCPIQDPAWADLFIEAITDYIVNQAEPEGYITVENADWLRERIARDGRVETKTELELLINVLDKARWAPFSLSAFALAQVKHAVLEGSGPIRAGRLLSPGIISDAEVDLLRRILYAFGGDQGIAISRAEAEVLFALNDATAGADNDPAWDELFVKAIAGAVMSASGYAAPSRQEALAKEAWLDSRGDLAPASTLAGMLSAGLSRTFGLYREQSPEERAMARLEQQRIDIVVNERISEGEALWLAEQLGRDGELTPNERALLEFLARESPSVHPHLKPLIERARATA